MEITYLFSFQISKIGKIIVPTSQGSFWGIKIMNACEALSMGSDT